MTCLDRYFRDFLKVFFGPASEKVGSFRRMTEGRPKYYERR